MDMNPDKLEVAPGTVHEGIEGWVPELASDDDIRVALEKAFDYRGDVTVTLKSGAKVEGYIFDRVAGPSLATSFVRLLPKTSNERLRFAMPIYRRWRLRAATRRPGKSFEAWIRKYWEKKAAGEGNLNLQPESLE